MLLLTSIWTVVLGLLGVLGVAVGSILSLVASVLVTVLSSPSVHSLWRGRVTPLVPSHHGVAVLVVLRILGLVEHRARSAPVHGWGTKVDWLRLAPGPSLGHGGLLRRQLGRQLVGRIARDVERLRVHRVDWDLWLLVLGWR